MATITTPLVEAPETEKSQAGLNEPSMEDILASIRRIIAEDQSNSLGRSGLGGLTRRASGAATAQAATAAPAIEAAPVDATPTAAAAVPAVTILPAGDRLIEQADGLDQTFVATQDLHEPEAATQDEPLSAAPLVVNEAVPAPAATPSAAAPKQDPFVAAELAASADDSWIEEAPLVSRSAGESITSSFHALAETVLLQDRDMVERVTRDVLRPMLKTWLDDNLPSIVERLVRVEIERVARGGRSRD